MIKNSAIEILKTFSREELELFGEFISASFHNRNSKVIQLFNILKKHHPYYSDTSLTKENLFFRLSGNKRFKDTYMRNLFSDLYNLTGKFLLNNLMTENRTFDRVLIEEIKNRDLYALAEKKIGSFEKEIKQMKIKDQEYYLNKNFIFEMKSFLLVDKTLKDNFRNEQISGIIKLFLITLMENTMYLLVEEQRVKIKHRYDFLKHVLEYIEKNLPDFEDTPLLMIQYYLWMHYFNSKEEKYFQKAKVYFKKHFDELTKIDKKNIYSVMQVYYINKIESGHNEYKKEFLNFLLEMLKFNVLSHKQKDSINLNLYRNILILCMMQKKTSILKKFVHKYSPLVDTNFKDTVKDYSVSHLLYLQGNFEDALELCNRINFNEFLLSANDNLFFKNDIKSLSLKCLYELKAWESAISYIDSFRHFVKNSKLIKEQPRTKYLNFLKFVKLLVGLNIEFDEFEFDKLKKTFRSTKELMHTDWLSDKISELE